MLTLSYITFSNNILNACIRCIWFNATYSIPNFSSPHCNMIVPLVQHYVISNGPLYGISYLIAALLSRTTFSPT